MFSVSSGLGFKIPLMTYKDYRKRVLDDGGVTEAETCFTNAVLDLQRLDAWNDASLVMIPSGYKDTKLYSVKPTDGDGDFTFSRGSNLAATRVNSEQLIEKGRENLLLQSNSFDTTWIKSNATVTGGQTGYDGSSDAWLQQSTSTFCRLDQNITQTGILTLSAYAKAGTSNFLLLEVTRSGGVFYAWFDLSSGVVGTTSAIDANIESLGNGWYRCSLIGNQTLSGQARLRVADSNGSTLTTTSSNIYIQDAQLELGLVSTDVITTTTTTAQAGILEDMPRLDYSGGASCPSLLLEPQRTNLFPQSEYLKDTNYWQVQNVSFSVNQGTSPEGQNNAIKVVPNSTGAAYWFDDTTLTSGQPYVLSFYAKSDGWDYLQVTNSSGVGGSETENFDIINGTSNGDYATGDAVIEEFGNGWYKIIVKGTANASTGRMVIALSSGLTMSRLGSVTPSGDDGVLLYGFQWEQGSYATSLIPTYGTSVTRSQDVCKITGANATEIIDKSAMTLYAEAELVDNNATTILAILRDATGGFYDDFIALTFNNSLKARFEVREGAAPQGTIDSSTLSEGTHKIAAVLTSTSMKLFVDGALSASTTITATPNDLDEIYLAGYPDTNIRFGTKKQFLFFPTALSDAEAIDLTTT